MGQEHGVPNHRRLCPNHFGMLADIVANFRSLIWGLALLGYPARWWKPVFWGLHDQHILSSFFHKGNGFSKVEKPVGCLTEGRGGGGLAQGLGGWLC